MNQTLYNFFVNTSNVSVTNVIATRSVFKLSVQSVRQLQQDTIEVSFEMTRLPYQWTPVANHSISISRQASARQCWPVLACVLRPSIATQMIIQ